MRTIRLVTTALLAIAACRADRPAADHAADDPWDRPAAAAAPPAPVGPRPPRKLSMTGKIEGARPELLATALPGYADPKVGDWRAYRYITTGELGNFHATAIAIVRAVTPTTVTIEFSGRLDETGEQRSDGADELPRAFTVEHEIHHQHGDWTASHVELADALRTVGGRDFPCKKLSFASVDPLMPGKDVRVTVWLSPDVPAGGEVTTYEVQKTEAFTITSTGDLIGFGDATHTRWGVRPPGL